MHAASRGHKRFEKIKKFETRKFEWCLCLQFVNKELRWNELLCSWEIVNQHFERKECFSTGSCDVLWELLQGSKNLDFHCCATPIIVTSMPMFATYRVKKTNYFIRENRQSLFWKKVMFFSAPVQEFWRRFCENQGRENFVLTSCSFKAYCQLHRLAFTRLDAMMDIRVSG